MTEGRILSIGWNPPFDPSGEFVVTMKEDERDWATRAQDEEAGKQFEPKLLAERRCDTIPELVAAVKSLLSESEQFHVRSPLVAVTVHTPDRCPECGKPQNPPILPNISQSKT